MIVPKEQRAFEDGEQWRGRFQIAGHPDTEVGGVLNWSSDRGAEAWIIGPMPGWPGGVFTGSTASGPLVVHGRSAADGKKITLPRALITNTTAGSGSQMKLVDRTLILNEHVESADQWKRLTARTASLHEWMPITGLEATVDMNKPFQARRVTLSWKAPRGRRVALRDGELRLSARMSADPGPWKPSYSIDTALDAIFISRDRDDLDALHGRFARPLLDLMMLVTGRPDAITYEHVSVGARTVATVMRQGLHVAPREWRPWQPPLFYAHHLPDIKAGLRRWFDLHRRVSPAMEVLTGSIAEGSSYSPSRLLAMASAVETFHRQLYGATWAYRWRRANPGKPLPHLSLLRRVEDLQRLARLSEPTTGMTDANRKLFVSTRNHFAHLAQPLYGYSEDQVYDSLLDTTRRGLALIQACVMRRLGFSRATAGQRFAEHYRNWRIPV